MFVSTCPSVEAEVNAGTLLNVTVECVYGVLSAGVSTGCGPVLMFLTRPRQTTSMSPAAFPLGHMQYIVTQILTWTLSSVSGSG